MVRHHHGWLCLIGMLDGNTIFGIKGDRSKNRIYAYGQNECLTFTERDYLFGDGNSGGHLALKGLEIFQII